MAAAACLLPAFACRPGSEPGDPSAARTRGEQVLAPFKRELQTALREGLARGPEEAVTVCRHDAPRIAAAQAKEGVEVGRTSHRLRNPGNEPRAWVAPLLDAYVRGEATEPRAVALGDDRMGYVEPIWMQGVCLTCHGAAVAPPVASRIQALYPEDRAVGFAEGELRGLFWAEFPEPTGAPL